MVPSPLSGSGVDNFFIGTDNKILFQSIQIHPHAIILNGDLFRSDFDMNICCICIIGIVDELSQELDAFRVEAFSYGDNVSFIDSDFKISFFFDIHFKE